jgi:uncharacterized small protein (DUF1192 family)
VAAGQNGNGPQLTWANVFVAIGVICVMVGGAYKIIEGQFESVKIFSDASFADLNKQIALTRHDIEKTRDEYLSQRLFDEYKAGLEPSLSAFRSRLAALEAEQRDLIAHAAHSPVESKEVDGLSSSVDKRIELLQNQINDINRQIAASILENGRRTIAPDK